MSFIAKNPLTSPEVESPTSIPPSGTRGLFAGEDGWYDIDSNGKKKELSGYEIGYDDEIDDYSDGDGYFCKLYKIVSGGREVGRLITPYFLIAFRAEPNGKRTQIKIQGDSAEAKIYARHWVGARPHQPAHWSDWENFYIEPADGIPKTDLALAVQTSLGLADTAIQSHQDISGKEDKGNKVTSMSGSSTDTQYPSAKCVYDALDGVNEEVGEIKGMIPTDASSDNKLADKSYVDQEIASAISRVYKFKGSKTVAQINALASRAIGDVYNVSDGGTITDGEHYSIVVKAGDNVVWADGEWDKLAADVDLSDYYTKSEVNTALSAKYEKPSGGIPKTDLSTGVKDSLDNADKVEQITVLSPNLFNTNGKTDNIGLNPANGNSYSANGYFTTDYIPVTASTVYGIYTGTFIVEYNSQKTYVTGENFTNGYTSGTWTTFTTSSTTEYIRITAAKTVAGDPTLQVLVEGGEQLSQYMPYGIFVDTKRITDNSIELSKLKGYRPNFYVVVDASGNGDYTTIAAAVAGVAEGGTIIVKAGSYNETVKCEDKTVHIIGIDKYKCRLYNDTGDYDNPPLYIASGSVRNMTVENVYTSGTIEHKKNLNGEYAVHIDTYPVNKQLVFDNCIIKSVWGNVFGCGAQNGEVLEIRDCTIIADKCSASTSNCQGFNMHGGNNGNESTVIFRNNVFQNVHGDKDIMFSLGSVEHDIYVHLYNNILSKAQNASPDYVHIMSDSCDNIAYGQGAPSSTQNPGFVGMQYWDTTNAKKYICTAVSANAQVFTWSQIAPVQSVSAAGTALTPDANGNVNIPMGEAQKFGVVKAGSNDWGIQLVSGVLYIPDINENYINSRSNGGGRAITISRLDYAVKRAMTDGKGTAWTDAEKNGAWKRTTIRKSTLDQVLVPNAQYDLGTTDQSTLTLTLPVPKGTASVTDLNDPDLTKTSGDIYILTNGGTLNAGSVAVVEGDWVEWTGTAWKKIDSYSCNEIYVAFKSGSTATSLTIVGDYEGDTSYLPSADCICELSFKYICGSWVLVTKETALS